MGDPFDVLFQAHRKRVSLCLAYAVVELEDFHTLMSLCLALEAMFIKSELTVGHILLRLEKNIE